MVSDNLGFSRITVSDEAEDEVVIHAGAQNDVFGEDGRAAGDRERPRVEERRDKRPEELVGESLEQRCDESGETNPEGRAEKVQPAVEQEEKRQRKAEKDAAPTSLDDLESFKMGAVQKAVIVLAAIGLLAFAVYYLFFM
ncbi:MAG TPA: hypothetical protein IAC28_06960 [Candidatus Aphodovivens excrementavium]|nr:hypothetical protein [Candidatus Aphodovivens excrementavium]